MSTPPVPLPSFPSTPFPGPVEVSGAARALHSDALVFDGHCDSVADQLLGARSLAERTQLGHLDLPRMIEGGVNAQFFACFVPTVLQRHGAVTHALERLDQLHLLAEQHPDRFAIARCAADIRAAKRAGQIAAVLGLEGAEALDASIGVLRQFYRLGVRNMGLAWNFRNAACDGALEERTGGGLTEFGVEVVRTCNDLGMLIDVSHLASAGLRDVLALSDAPVLASHSNARALCDHVRNLTDAQMEAIAARGGVIGITFVHIFLDAEAPDSTTVDTVLDHIDYVLRRVGPDHVALGSDYDGCIPPTDLGDVTRYPLLTEGMLRRGHDEQTIRKVLGGNLLRLFERVCG